MVYFLYFCEKNSPQRTQSYLISLSYELFDFLVYSRSFAIGQDDNKVKKETSVELRVLCGEINKRNGI